MTTRSPKRTFVLLSVCALIACGKSKPEQTDQTEAVQAEQPAPPSGKKFRVVLPAPVEGKRTADLSIRLTGEFLEEVHGADGVSVEGGVPEPGMKHMYRVHADDSELQRMEVGGTQVLITIPPESSMAIGDQPCFGWEMKSARFDPGLHAGQPRSDGFCYKGWSKVAADYRCPAPTVVDEHCCLQTAVLSFGDSAGRVKELTNPGGGEEQLWDDGTIEIIPGGCGFYTAKTAAGEVGLAIAFGEKWELAIDETGVVTGKAVPTE